MDGQCCLGCGRPATFEFKNLETGYEDKLCTEHAKSLDARNPERFLSVRGVNDRAMSPADAASVEKLKHEISDAYSRRQLQGQRIHEREPKTPVLERDMQKLEQERDSLRWRHEAGIDRWDHPPPERPTHPPPSYGIEL